MSSPSFAKYLVTQYTFHDNTTQPTIPARWRAHDRDILRVMASLLLLNVPSLHPTTTFVPVNFKRILDVSKFITNLSDAYLHTNYRCISSDRTRCLLQIHQSLPLSNTPILETTPMVPLPRKPNLVQRQVCATSESLVL